MRELEVSVSEDYYSEAVSVLRERDIQFTERQRADGGFLLRFPLPTAAVSVVLCELTEAGVDTESYTVVTKAELIRTSTFSALRQRYSSSIRKLAADELHAKILELQWPYQLYYVGTLLSVFAAAAGLLLDQPALVIGAMVIAPQASSALASPAGVLTGDWELFVDSVREQALGLGMAILGAALFGWGLRQTALVSPTLSITRIDLVSVRLAPSFLSTIGALVAGIVGAFGYTTEQTTSLIGVMIAAALIPAAAAAGLGIAWGASLLAVGSTLLLLLNILAINIGAFGTLVAMGYTPEWMGSDQSFFESIPSERRIAVLGMLFVILAATAGTAYLTAAHIAFTRDIHRETGDALNEQPYTSLSLTGITSEQWRPTPGGDPTNVTVQVSRTSNRTYPRLASALERRIQQRTGRDVTVIVQFTDTRTASSPLSHAPAASLLIRRTQN